jgi:CO/xanthine dehydrogenase FAD-binding subunit
MGTLGGNLTLDTRCVYYNQPEGWRRAIGGCLKCEGSVCHVAPKGRGCYATHSADTVPVLLLLGASVTVARASSAERADTRETCVEDLYDGEDGRRWLRLAPGELVTEVHVPRETTPVAYRKGRLRAAIDYGYLLVAVQRRPDGLHAVVGAVAPAPVRVAAPDIEALVAAAHAAAQPLGTHLPSPAWRRRMIAVELRRAVATLGG